MKKHMIASVVYKVGINFCVDVPRDVCRALGNENYIPVIATVAGLSVRTTLVPAAQGLHRLYLNGAIRRAARVRDGDIASVLLRRDEESRELPLPDDLRAALRTVRGARSAFDAMTPGLRREFLMWLGAAKQPETRARRIQIGIEKIIQRAAKHRSD